jgi:hypothetical protein
MRIFSRLTITALFVISFASLLPAQRTIRVNLERMVQKSGVIVHATVTKIESGKDARSHLLFTSVTVRVHENFYGTSDSLYTFRQFGGRSNGIAFYPSKMVHYTEGQDLILMLYPVSKTGLQSPVGAEQGVFNIKVNTAGAKEASNALANRALFAGIKQTKMLGKLSATQQSSPEGLPLADFSQAIRSLVSTYKK